MICFNLLKVASVITFAVALDISEETQALTINLSGGSSADTINNAIGRVSSAGGGTVYLATGTYHLNHPLVMETGVTLKGSGMSNTILLGPVTPYSWTMVLTSGNGLHDITVQDMTLDGNCPQNASGETNGYVNQAGLDCTCPSFGQISHVTFNNLEVKNCSVGMHGANVNFYTVSSCTIHDCGMWVRTRLWQHDLYFNACENVLLTNSSFINSWQGCGIHLDSTTGDGSTWTVSHCITTNNAECGILVQDGKNVVDVDHCTVSNNGFGTNYVTIQQGQDGLNFTGGTGCTIAFNLFSANKGYGVEVFSGEGRLLGNSCYANILGQYAIHPSWKQR